MNERENVKHQLQREHEEQLRSLKVEFNKLQRTHEESLDILREENDAIREQIDENKMIIEELKKHKCENEKFLKEYQVKEMSYKEQLEAANEEIVRLREENSHVLACYGDDPDKSMQVTWL